MDGGCDRTVGENPHAFSYVCDLYETPGVALPVKADIFTPCKPRTV